MMRSALILILLTLAACDRTTSDVSRAVRNYDEALVVAFRTGDLAPLRKTAGEKEVRKVTALIDLKRASGLVLESSFEDFAVESVKITGTDGALVKTSETWTYHDRAAVPGKAPGDTFVAKMTMEYTMQHNGGTWRVTQARTLANDFLAPKEFRMQKIAQGAETSR
jgi:hypothetical protein